MYEMLPIKLPRGPPISLPSKVPDLVNSKTAVRAAMYRETKNFPLASKETHPRRYLVLYQTDMEECLKSEEYRNDVRHSSDMWPASKETAAIGDFDARNYKLIQDYDPDSKGESESRMNQSQELLFC